MQEGELQTVMRELRAQLKADPNILRFELMGSASLPNAEALLVNDVDFAVLVDSEEHLAKQGWTFTDDYEARDTWTSYRKGHGNLIATEDVDVYETTVRAARVCVLLNLTNKVDRIAVFRVVRDGMNVLAARVDAARFAGEM